MNCENCLGPHEADYAALHTAASGDGVPARPPGRATGVCGADGAPLARPRVPPLLLLLPI